MTLVPPYDDPEIIAGQGTIGLELLEEAEALGITLDAIVVPCGGGGLSSGIALAIKSRSPRTEVWVAEPENFDDTRRSLEVGHHVKNSRGTIRYATPS
jgi:threonine dehydratase